MYSILAFPLLLSATLASSMAFGALSEKDRAERSSIAASTSAAPSAATCMLCHESFHGGLMWHNFSQGHAMSTPNVQAPAVWALAAGGADSESEDWLSESFLPELVDAGHTLAGQSPAESENGAFELGTKYDCHSFNACHGNEQVNFCGQNHHECNIIYHDFAQAIEEAVRDRSLFSILEVAGRSNGRVRLDGTRRRVLVRDCSGAERALSLA